MSYAQIELEFTKAVYPLDLPDEYMLKTEVNPANTNPDAVDTCLVILKGDSTIDEELVRVAAYADLITVPLDPLPTSVDVFTSPALAFTQLGTPSPVPTVIAEDDIIRITTPQTWRTYFAAGVQEEYTVVTVNSPTEVVVTPAFPAFGRGLSFEVERSGALILPNTITPPPLEYPSDGVATRDYTAVTGTHFLTGVHVDTWPSWATADNRLTNLKSQASVLVEALNTDDWTGFEEVTYP